MDSRVYTLINATLQETDYLRQYSSTKLTQAKFEKSVGDNLVLLTSDRNATSGSQGSDSSSSSGNVKGTVVAALVSFMFSAVVMYGFYYKSKDDGKGTTTAMTERIARVQAKRRQFFQQLEDDPSLATGWMVTDAPSPTHPTIAWSDLTSDSESIKSSLPLDRIDEEVSSNEDGENEGEDIEVALSEIGSLPVSRDLSPIHIDHLEFIARWNDQAEGSELASYPDEAKEEVTGNFADHYRNINNYISEPFWLEEDETPVASNRITDDGTATDVFLRRCEFYYGRDESGCNDDDDDESSTSSYLEGDENKENKLDIPNAIVRLDATANLSKSKGPSSDISNATTEGLTADTESSLASDPKLADWVRGVLQKLSGNVKLLTCGTEDMV